MNSFTIPKDNHNFRWTNHVVRKMQFYGLTPSRVLRVIRAPERVEIGVAEGTLAGLQTAGTKKKPWEIWTMWRDAKEVPRQARDSNNNFSGKIIITAWRYPGVSPIRERAPVPADILAELAQEGVY